MAPPRVTLAGVPIGGPLALPGGAVPWELRAGTSPTEYAWEVSAQRAKELEGKQGQPLTLQVEGPKPLTVQHVYLLEIHPGRNEGTRILKLADRRWKWARPHLTASCNVHRASGERYLLTDEKLLENAIIDDTIRYATYSLYPPETPNTPWTAITVLRWVFEEMSKALNEDVPYKVRDALPQIEIRDLELDGTAADCLEQALRYLPGVDVFIDRDGTTVVYDTRAPGAAEAVLSRLKQRPQDSGVYAQVVDRRATRPRFVRVLFTPEVECKFTFREGGTRARDSTSLSNVLQSPDLTLTLSDGTKVARGSWLELDDAFSAWGSFGMLSEPLSTTHLRKHALRAGFASLESIWGNDPKVPYVDGQAASRARAAVRHWRRVYALERIFFGRLLAIRAVRAAILNTTTGRRAEARAYCDWTRKPSLFAIAKPTDTNTSAGWSTAGFAEALNDCEAAPANVKVRDPQAGVIEVEPELDPEGRASAMVFGRPADGILPDIRIGQANKTANAVWALWDKIELGATFNLHVVMTVVPGTPNNVGRLWSVDVQAGDVDAGEALGPPVYVRVYPGVCTARFAWSDDAAEQIVAGIKGLSPLPADRLVDADLLDEVAKASAKRIYDLFRDEPLGAFQVDLDPELEPVGSLSSVRHAVVSGAATVTEARFAGVRRPVDIWRYLPASARRALLHVLQDGSVTA